MRRNSRGTETVARSRALRNAPTDAERRLWSVLRGDAFGVRFRRQLPIGPFIADVCAPELKLVVEVDGGQHADNPDDARRTAWLEAKGYRVIRFWNTDVLLATAEVAASIFEAVTELKAAKPSPPAPLPRGEGGGTTSSAHFAGRPRGRNS